MNVKLEKTLKKTRQLLKQANGGDTVTRFKSGRQSVESQAK